MTAPAVRYIAQLDRLNKEGAMFNLARPSDDHFLDVEMDRATFDVLGRPTLLSVTVEPWVSPA